MGACYGTWDRVGGRVGCARIYECRYRTTAARHSLLVDRLNIMIIKYYFNFLLLCALLSQSEKSHIKLASISLKWPPCKW